MRPRYEPGAVVSFGAVTLQLSSRRQSAHPWRPAPTPRRSTFYEYSTPDRFFGIGFYEVRLRVRDRDGGRSRVVSKRWLQGTEYRDRARAGSRRFVREAEATRREVAGNLSLLRGVRKLRPTWSADEIGLLIGIQSRLARKHASGVTSPQANSCASMQSDPGG
jgi:hypothetical protein